MKRPKFHCPLTLASTDHHFFIFSVADPHRKNADANADPGKNLNADADLDVDADSCSY
jgi:hypothetical protein